MGGKGRSAPSSLPADHPWCYWSASEPAPRPGGASGDGKLRPGPPSTQGERCLSPPPCLPTSCKPL